MLYANNLFRMIARYFFDVQSKVTELNILRYHYSKANALLLQFFFRPKGVKSQERL